MDIQNNAILEAGVTTEPLEPHPVDLGETSDRRQEPAEDLPPVGPESTLDVAPTLPNVDPGGTRIPTKSGHTEGPGWIVDPPDASPQVCPGAGGQGPRNGVDPVMEEEGEDSDIAAEDVLEADAARGHLARLERPADRSPSSEDGLLAASDGEENPASAEGEEQSLLPCPLHLTTGHGLGAASAWPLRRPRKNRRGLLSAETDREDLLSLLGYEGGVDSGREMPPDHLDVVVGRAGTSPGPPEETERGPREDGGGRDDETSSDSNLRPDCVEEPLPDKAGSVVEEHQVDLSSFPAFREVAGPCEPEDLREGVIFGAKYLGSTQLVSERNPPSSVRMAQAQEAMDRVKAPEGESQPMTEVDLFVSTQRIKVLTTDSQETMMDHPLQTISYIADIGNIVVLMARRKLPRRAASASGEKALYKMICHVFRSADAQLIAQAIGQAFGVAYQHFLQASGIDPRQLPGNKGEEEEDEDDEDDDALAQGEELYNGDLAHFSKQENCKKVVLWKEKGEILGLAVVESGWGSILPTVVVANLLHGGAAERSGRLSIGDRIMSVNGTSLVGLPLAACQSIIRDLKNETEVTLSVVHCPPVTTAIVRRPDTKYPLGFCVENGIICSLLRGGIAERGGIRVGHHIIEINSQSVVAMPHEKIIQILTQAVNEVRIKTMPASTYRLLTGQEQPVFL